MTKLSILVLNLKVDAQHCKPQKKGGNQNFRNESGNEWGMYLQACFYAFTKGPHLCQSSFQNVLMHCNTICGLLVQFLCLECCLFSCVHVPKNCTWKFCCLTSTAIIFEKLFSGQLFFPVAIHSMSNLCSHLKCSLVILKYIVCEKGWRDIWHVYFYWTCIQITEIFHFRIRAYLFFYWERRRMDSPPWSPFLDSKSRRKL